MAHFDYDPNTRRYHIRFRFEGKPYKRSLPLEGDGEAEQVCGTIEETIKDLKRGRIVIPEGAEPGAFLIAGGKVVKVSRSSSPPTAPDVLTLGRVFATYAATLTP